jgi:hypothetical protein
MLSWYCFQILFRPLLTIPVAPMITGMTKHFIFHIRWITILRCSNNVSVKVKFSLFLTKYKCMNIDPVLN